MTDLKTTLKSGNYRVLPVTTADQVEVPFEEANLLVLLESMRSKIQSLEQKVNALEETSMQIDLPTAEE